jgi:hypothetical protein
MAIFGAADFVTTLLEVVAAGVEEDLGLATFSSSVKLFFCFLEGKHIIGSSYWKQELWEEGEVMVWMTVGS